jgi:hypothetical protein
MTVPIGRVQVDALYDPNGNLVPLPLPASAVPYAILVADEKANGTPGDASSAGWAIRPLQTSKFNNITGASLAANVVTIPAGTYIAWACATIGTNNGGVGLARMGIYNSSDAAFVAQGPNNYPANNNCFLQTAWGVFTIAAQKDISVQQYTANAVPGGFGMAVSAGTAEVYTQLLLVKVS